MATKSSHAEPMRVGHIVPPSGEDAAGEAFVYLGVGDDEVGYICCGGDVYDNLDRRVGHVTITASGEGRIYRGDDREVGWVSLERGEDGVVRDRHDFRMLGVVSGRGVVYKADGAAPLGFIRPPTNVQLMAGAALLLRLVGEARRQEVAR